MIEVSKDSNLKYMYDPSETKLQLDRILPYKLKYPFNYGHVPNTLNTDGQELDIVLLLDEPLAPGTIIKCKIIGGLEYTDEKGKDNKLIVCPANDVDYRFININDITNLKPETLNKIRYFFEHYKDNLHINVKTGKFLNKIQATKLYHDSKI
jgi:inorganic pyrophosphatase